ncbi:MAG: hypothetical protein ACRD5M_01780 [Candidatus Acidiferrales bacterium]
MRIVCAGLLVLLALPVGIASAQQQPQQQTDSLAEAARRAREQKKDQAKATKVWDDDTVPKVPGGVNVVGQPVPSTDSNPPAANAPGAAAAAPEEKSGKDVKALQASLASAKDRLQSVKTDLDILKRKYDLDSQMYYGKPNYVADTDGAAKIADEKSQVDAKQQEVDAAQKKVDEIEAELKDSGAGGDTTSSKTN